MTNQMTSQVTRRKQISIFSKISLAIQILTVVTQAHARPPVPGTPPRPGQPPAPAPTPVSTGQAQSDAQSNGRIDGRADGAREGRDRGPSEGRRDGERIGYREGHDRCEREESQRAYDRGYHEGYRSGATQGASDGYSRGDVDGNQRGQRDGREDGEKRADQDSRRVAGPAGAAKGVEEANSSDASARGTADGIAAGEQQARDQALRVDYPRGREDYRYERNAEPVQFHDSFSQLGSSQPSSRIGPVATLGPVFSQGNLQRIDVGGGTAFPDYRYSNPRRTYPTAEENRAYQAGYRSGYDSGFSSEYGASYRFAYQHAYSYSSRRGCDDARREDHSWDYRRGLDRGRDDGYRSAYRSAYDNAFASAYHQAFSGASRLAYDDHYQSYYDRHYEEARSLAYAERVGELYQAAKTQAQRRKYQEAYPGYADQQYERGRRDEEQDFLSRPVRLLDAQASESNDNDLFEPGEPLHIRVNLRNYASVALAQRDITLKIDALDADSAVISQAQTSLVRPLRPKSITEVRDALEFRMNESAAGRVKRFVVTAFYQGRNVGQVTIQLKTDFMIKVELAGQPTLKDGLPAAVKFRLTNQSRKPTGSGLKVHFAARAAQLVIPEPEQTTASLNAGEARIVEYSVIAHSSGSSIQFPIAVSVSEDTGRRIGLLDLTEEVPVANDYRISLTRSAQGLLRAGVTRLNYRITNTGSRLLNKGLQLKVSFSGVDNSSDFAVIGPNPQYLSPLSLGESTSFVVPILVKADNSGGSILFELREDGRPVVIHEFDFKKPILDIESALN